MSLLITVTALGAMSEQDLSAGENLLATDWLSTVSLSHGPQKGDGQMDVVDVQGQDFPQALRVTTVKRPSSDWHVQVLLPTQKSVEHGQVMLATFSARAIQPQADSGEAQVKFQFRQAQPPRQPSVIFVASVAEQWKSFSIPFVVDLSKVAKVQKAGQMLVALNLGFAPQVIEIADLKVKRFDPVVKVEDLPRTQITYQGREPDASWRSEALKRIQKHRKADMKIKVTDAEGKAITDAQVHVKMLRHAFGFGSVVNSARLWELTDEPDHSRYQQTFLTLFNMASLEGAMKPMYWHTPRYRDLADRSVQWLFDHNIMIRGHTLVWPEWHRYDTSVKARFENKPHDLQDYLLTHIQEQVQTYAGKMVCYDVVNELYLGDQMQTLIGDHAVAQWLKATKQADPQTQTYLNDNRLIAAGAQDQLRIEYYEKLFSELKLQNAPLDGMGLQGHFGSQLTPPDRLLQILDRLAAHQLKIQVTEFTVDVMDQALQADYTRDALTVFFSHPAMNAVTLWGFWEGQMYYKQAALFDKHWQIKPNGKVYQDLVFKQWWTDEQRSTDADGQVQLRGFKGDYQITVIHNGQRVQRTMNLGDAGSVLVIGLKDQH
ncbi:MAG: hypothetical protein CMJ19_20030 [Phycisphaeraceae bacterium]|nr:hypothetical protein [Phycisphaeraceae bacterium]